MKLKIFNWLITLLAVFGVIMFVGAVGKMDYMVEVGMDYPIIETIKTIGIGILMVIPAVVREVML